jgi:ketosteroid isomerase-like protein
MKRLVLLGEGHGEVSALPALVGRLLREKDTRDTLFVDHDVIREPNPVKWDKQAASPDYSKWVSRVTLAARRRDVGGVLAIYDGDAPSFPAGSGSRFCAATAARSMTGAAAAAGAGKTFSLAVVFACVEYETWIIAGIESLAGKKYKDGRPALSPNLKFPPGEPESHGKRWLEQNCQGYRPTLDQNLLIRFVDKTLFLVILAAHRDGQMWPEKYGTIRVHRKMDQRARFGDGVARACRDA